jgi:hypothetical protein
MPPVPYTPSSEELLRGVEYVVHEYANLLSAAHHSLYGRPPWRTHCDDAFLLGCRKMEDFLLRTRRSVSPDRKRELDDVLALDYLPQGFAIDWELPTWARWRGPMNKQLAHIAYTHEQSWDHTRWVPQLRDEFRLAWAAFLGAITDETYRDAFAAHLDRKQELVGLP